MLNQSRSGYGKILLFCIIISLVAYGFSLTNFFISVDNELPATKDSSMDLGRWGTNLFLYQIFREIIPYYTLLLSLLFMSVAAVSITSIFKFKDYTAYIFCALFLSFPQMAYQFVFLMQANAIGCGFMCSAFAVQLFMASLEQKKKIVSAGYLLLAALLIMFVMACYQALIFIPVIIYLGYIYVNTHNETYTLKSEFKKALLFGGMLLIGAMLYFISVKILCPQANQGGGFMKSYGEGDSSDRFVDFYNLWVDNLRGNMFYGDKTFVAASILSIVLIGYTAFKNRKKLLIRAALVFLLLLVPFSISFFILNGYHPPRLYVASGITFAFIIAQLASEINFNKIAVAFTAFIVLTNVYYITMLYNSQNKIYTHDLTMARRINEKIYQVNPNFDEKTNFVYFYGASPAAAYENFRLPNSEIFGGSIFQWDGGNNYRIAAFCSITDAGNYKIIDTKETFDKVKDSTSKMAVWPKEGSVKQIDNVMVVKLGAEKGAKLWVE